MSAALSRIAAPGFALLLAFGLAACQSAPERPSLEPISFDDQPAIGLNVAEIRTAQTYEPPMEDPYVEHLFPDPPARAAKRWARERLEARGSRGTATFTVEEASVEQVPLETEGGLTGWLTTEPGTRYEALLTVRLEAERGGESASLTVTGERTTSLREGATLNEREETWHALTRRLMQDVDARLESALREGFPKFTVN